ncbi:uncharacterized protein DS421_17g575160 [Arachis hypogaea]|nr:uncharacterized protein DS421_17g575160 [Arachis hypogaea]
MLPIFFISILWSSIITLYQGQKTHTLNKIIEDYKKEETRRAKRLTNKLQLRPAKMFLQWR